MYFKKFDFISEDKSAKSLSYHFDGISYLSQDILNELKCTGKKVNSPVRISLHNSPEEDLHNMVIFAPRIQDIHVHKHLTKSETYHLVEGEMVILLFTEKGTLQKTIFLSKNKNLICRVPKNTYHANIVFSDYVIFHESRKGPFTKGGDSIIPEWNKQINQKIPKERHNYES